MIRNLDHLGYLRHMRQVLEGAARTIQLRMYMIRPPRHGEVGIYADMFAALLAAPARGVACRAILNKFDLAQKAAPYNNVAARLMADHGWRIRYPAPRVIEHAKIAIIDSRLVVCGSSNAAYDDRRATLNANTAHDDHAAALDACAAFEQIWAAGRALAPLP